KALFLFLVGCTFWEECSVLGFRKWSPNESGSSGRLMFLHNVSFTPESHGWHRITHNGNRKSEHNGWHNRCMAVLRGGSPLCCSGLCSPRGVEWSLPGFERLESATTFRISTSSCKASVGSGGNWEPGCWCWSCRFSKTNNACCWRS